MNPIVGGSILVHNSIGTASNLVVEGAVAGEANGDVASFNDDGVECRGNADFRDVVWKPNDEIRQEEIVIPNKRLVADKRLIIIVYIVV